MHQALCQTLNITITIWGIIIILNLGMGVGGGESGLEKVKHFPKVTWSDIKIQSPIF